MRSEQNIPDWNKDGVWENVEDTLRQKKKRRLFLWRFTGIVGSILLIGLFASIKKQETTNTAINTAINQNPISTTQAIPSTQKTQTKTTLDKSTVKKENAKLTDSKLKISKQKNKESNAQIKRRANSDQRSAKNITTPASAKIKAAPENMQVTFTEIYNKVIASATTNVKSDRNQAIVSVPQKTIPEKTESKSTVDKENDEINSLPSLSTELLAISSRPDPLLTQNFKFALPKENNKEKTSTFWWIESGLSFGNRSSINLTEQASSRDAAEQFRFIHSNEIGIQKFLNDNWSIKLALAYQTIYEKYEHIQIFITEDQVFAEQGITYNLPNGIVYTESGLATLKSSTSREITHNNLTHRLSLPIEIAYIFEKKSWSLEPSLGLRFQFYQQFDGIIVQNAAHFFDVAEINESYYPIDTNLGLVSSLNLKYNISQRSSLGLKISYEKDDFLKLNKNDFYLRYETIGLRLGYYHAL